MMKVYALTKYSNDGASSRVRFFNLVEPLRQRGVDVALFPLLSNSVLRLFYRTKRHRRFTLAIATWKRIILVLKLQESNILWIEKEIVFGLPDIMEKLLFPRLIQTIIDYDDAVYLNYQDHRLKQYGRIQKFKRYAREAGCITAGSESIINTMHDWGCKRIRKVPSTVSVGRYPLHCHSAIRGYIIIGWIGTPKTVHFLELLKRVLQILSEYRPIRVHIVGAKWECPGVDVRCFAWSGESEANLVGEFDVGVMPLNDGVWEAAKCGYKLIQYMAAGVVPVGSRVGENRYLIQEGITGYLASTEDEWIQTLLLLASNAELRSVIGSQAREYALRKYDTEVAASAVHEVFNAVTVNKW